MLHGSMNGRVHRMLAKKFPYALYDKVDAEFVDVVAILDCRRNPSGIFKSLADKHGFGNFHEIA